MKRHHLFEFEDFPWFPQSIRDCMTDYLQFMFSRMDLYAPVVDILNRYLKETGCNRIVDLCSGGAGPIIDLQKNLAPRVSVLLTDKFPNLPKFKLIHEKSGGAITYLDTSVDATQLPKTLRGFRTLFTAFHHFKPETAQAILADAVNNQMPIGVFELTERKWPTFLRLLPLPVLVAVMTPFIRPFTWKRLLWTYLLPVVPLVILWDGLVSVARTYSPRDLEKMTEKLRDGYRWDIGTRKTSLTMTITYLVGYPSRKDDRSGARQPREKLLH